FTVEQLLTAMGDAAPGRSTVYRALDRLVEEGTVRRFAPESGGSAAYQAMDPGHCDAHLHLKCVGCGRLIHLDTGVSDALQADLLRAAGFTVDGRSTTIYGTCAACGGKRGGHA
ncbi:MAG: transcriptional repressor, partial [Oscillospiraceae bacterium]|nr:transcriptional repressor [Oscillospiraceae bacterium]